MYYFFLFSGYSKSTVGENGDSPKVYTFYSDGNFQKKCVNPLGFNFPRIYNLLENFSLVNSHNLLANLLLFPTEITNLLFVIKTNSRWNKILCWIVKNYDKEKRTNTISQMRLGSGFKMRMSILNTTTTEQMGYSIRSFFVYTKSTHKYFFNFFVDKFLSLGYYKTVMIIITFSKKIFITMQCYLYAFDNE